MKCALLLLSACALSARAIKTSARPPKAEDDLEGVHSKIASRPGLRGARSSTTTTGTTTTMMMKPSPPPSTPFLWLATSLDFNEDSYQRALDRLNAQNHEVEVATRFRLRGAKVPNATGRKFDELDDELDAVLKKFSQIDNPRSVLNPENGVVRARRDSGLDGDFGGGDDVLGNNGDGGAHFDVDLTGSEVHNAARLASTHSGPFLRNFENVGPLLVGDANENMEQNAEQNANDAPNAENMELDVENIPSYDDWVDAGNAPTGETANGGLSTVNGGVWTDPGLQPTLTSLMPRVATLGEGMFLDTQNALTRTLMMLGSKNGARTQAATSRNSLDRIVRKVNSEARAGDPDAIAMWLLIDEIVRAIEATGLTRMGRVRILQGMMVYTFFQNSLARRSDQVPDGLDEQQSVVVANVVAALELGAQCAYANAAATNQADGQAPNLLEFWQQMDEASTGAEQTALFRPMWEEEYWQTPVDIIAIMMPRYNVYEGVPRPVLVVCAFSTTFRDLRQGTTWSRLLTSSAHRCFESARLQHSGVDGRVPDGHTLDEHLLALGSEPNAISTVFGLVGHTTSTTSTTSSTTTTQAHMTNYGVKPFLMVAPPGSEHFATCIENEVGPFDVVDTLAEGDVVRRAIFHLFNNGSPYVGYVDLAHLLFSDHDNWDMGATFES